MMFRIWFARALFDIHNDVCLYHLSYYAVESLDFLLASAIVLFSSEILVY